MIEQSKWQENFSLLKAKTDNSPEAQIKYLRQITSDFYVLDSSHVKILSWNWVAFTPPEYKKIQKYLHIFMICNNMTYE
jgi:hypothetical protein